MRKVTCRKISKFGNPSPTRDGGDDRDDGGDARSNDGVGRAQYYLGTRRALSSPLPTEGATQNIPADNELTTRSKHVHHDRSDIGTQNSSGPALFPISPTSCLKWKEITQKRILIKTQDHDNICGNKVMLHRLQERLKQRNEMVEEGFTRRSRKASDPSARKVDISEKIGNNDEQVPTLRA